MDLGIEQARENRWATDLAKAIQDNNDKNVKSLLETRVTEIARTSKTRSHDKLFGTIGLVDALCIAIERGRSQLAILLIGAKGAELSLTRSGVSLRTPLHEAVKWQNITIVNELLNYSECARHINNKDKDGRVALHEAAAYSNRGIVEVLLADGANVDARDACDMTPLHLMVWYRLTRNNKVNEAILDTLVASGADINTKDDTGSTPLHVACTHGDLHLATALLAHGADPDAKDADGQTPQHVTPDTYEELHQKLDWLRDSERKSVAHIPMKKPCCPKRNRTVCDNASVYVRYYSHKGDKTWAASTSVSQLIYDEDTEGKTGLQETFEQFRDIVLELPSEGDVSGSKPPSAENVWKWIHLHANNMTWVKDLIWLITHSEGYDPHERSQIWRFWEQTINTRKAGAERKRVPHAQDSREGDRVRSNVNDSKGALPKFSIGTENASSENASSENASSGELRTYFPKKRKLSLVLPFIDIETKSFLNLEKLGKPHGKMKKMMDLFRRYRPYEGQDGLQVPSTLDGSYYDMLKPKRIRERDEDQVVLKWFESQEIALDSWTGLDELLSRYGMILDDQNSIASSPGSSQNDEDSAGTVGLHEATIIENGGPIPLKNSAKSHATDYHTVDGPAKLLMVHQLWLWKLDDNTVITCCPDRCHIGPGNTLIDTIRQSGIESMKEPDDLIQHILYKCATSVDKLHSAGLDAHILDIFDDHIANMSEEEVVLFKQFQKNMEERDRKKNQNITAEIKLLYGVKDICDELKLLKRIFEIQSRVLSDFTRIFWPGDQERRDSFLENCGVKTLIDRTAGIDQNAKNTLGELNFLIQIKQTQSSLDEAEAARLLNNNIFLFTIVTIIFTPLSFITSLFAVPIKQFPHDGTSNLSYDSIWITERMFAGELTTLAVVAIIAVMIIFQWRPSFRNLSPFNNLNKRPGRNFTPFGKLGKYTTARNRHQLDEEATAGS
ncbi:hypothetical protein F4803DRAFT_103355 [Xylaria telfairii]|nr:hypothetical protein F4803DRAFT_103355 [Xylaria telfairii]